MRPVHPAHRFHRRSRELARFGGRVRRDLALLLAATLFAGACGASSPRSPSPPPPPPGPHEATPATPPGTPFLLAAPPGPPAAAPPRGTMPCLGCTPEQELVLELDRIFDVPVLRQAIVGVKVQSLDSGDPMYVANPDTLLVPASNTKIVTLAVAAARLGWDFRFETRLESSAPVVDGTLTGDLFVVGGGDPSINERTEGGSAAAFGELAAALSAAGVSRIEGRIVADDRAFAGPAWGFGWSWDDFAHGYQAPVTALQYNQNLADVAIRPGALPGDVAVVELRTPGTGLTVVNGAVTTMRGTPRALDLFRFPGSDRLEVTGTIPIGAGEVVMWGAVGDPATFFGRAFRDALIAHGIAVSGDVLRFEAWCAATPGQCPGVAVGSPPRVLRVLARRHSPPLAELAKPLMKASQNLYAETVLRALSLTPGPASVQASREAAEDTLSGWGLAPGDYVLADGSGLSRHNLLSASAVVRILQVMARTPELSEAFQAALAVAGRDGTLTNRLRATRAESNVAAKTGSLLRVRALSGYVTTADGEHLAFSMLANHYTAPSRAVDAVMDQALERLASFSRKRPTS